MLDWNTILDWAIKVLLYVFSAGFLIGLIGVIVGTLAVAGLLVHKLFLESIWEGIKSSIPKRNPRASV